MLSRVYWVNPQPPDGQGALDELGKFLRELFKEQIKELQDTQERLKRKVAKDSQGQPVGQIGGKAKTNINWGHSNKSANILFAVNGWR